MPPGPPAVGDANSIHPGGWVCYSGGFFIFLILLYSTPEWLWSISHDWRLGFWRWASSNNNYTNTIDQVEYGQPQSQSHIQLQPDNDSCHKRPGAVWSVPVPIPRSTATWQWQLAHDETAVATTQPKINQSYSWFIPGTRYDPGLETNQRILALLIGGECWPLLLCLAWG